VTSRRLSLVVGILIIGVLAVGTVAMNLLAPDPHQVCDGVERSLGGCDAEQPTFTGRTCEAVGTEFGEQLDRRIVAILAGEDVVDSQGKSARVTAAEYLLTTRANQHLRAIGIVDQCGADEFLAVAEAEFSDALKTDLGPALSEFQDHQYTYEEWRANLRLTLRAIDMDEESSRLMRPTSGDA
jgi:hypothetical protein